MKTVTNNMTI